MQSRLVTFISDFLLILKYRSLGVSTSFLLNHFHPKYDGHIPILSAVDVFEKPIVDVYIGNSIKAKDFIITLRKAIEYRKINPENLIIRTDNGPQFKAKITSAFMKELTLLNLIIRRCI